MSILPKREYLLLFVGDIAVFALSLWVTLALRNLEFPGWELFEQHLLPFTILFAAWAIVFLIAGLYGKHTRIFRSTLSATILYAQVSNVVLAALFFFLIPIFGIAPKTILVLYLVVSFVLIFVWRRTVFPRLRAQGRTSGALFAPGDDAALLAREAASDARFPFAFKYVVDTATAAESEIVEQARLVSEDPDITFLVMDRYDRATEPALPFIYDGAFYKHRFALFDAIDLYEEVFDRVPLTLIRHEWILANVSASHTYDILKRSMDIVISAVAGLVSLLAFPLVALAIKLDDGGDVFIAQERVGRFQLPVRIYKFRSMNGNDEGAYGASGASTLKVTRVGRWLRALRIDEIPQLWNVFRGDLSIVGPRPELPALASRYSSEIPFYSARYLISPGLTGWAQLRHDMHPHHGTAVAETRGKLSYDLYYLKNRSLVLDLFIMLQTVRIVLTARGR